MWDYYIGGVVVGLLHGGCSSGTTTWGGGVVVPHKSEKKVEQKIRQFRRALNQVAPLYVGKSKKKSLFFFQDVGLLLGAAKADCSRARRWVSGL